MQSTPHQHFVLCRPGAGCAGPGGSPVTKPSAEVAKQGSPETPIPALATGGSAERPVDVCLRCISAKQTCNIILDQQTLEKGSRDLQEFILQSPVRPSDASTSASSSILAAWGSLSQLLGTAGPQLGVVVDGVSQVVSELGGNGHGEENPSNSMPLAGTPAPKKKRKPTKLILELTQEVMPQEGSKLNLGKKISIPRDVMLEELSLLTNRGSKMFKLRQLRVEKFIYENNPDAFTSDSMDHFQRFIPSVGGHYGADSWRYTHSGGRMMSGVTVGPYGSTKLQYPPTPPAKPGSKGGAGGTGTGHSEGSAGRGGGVDGGGNGNETGGGKGESKSGSGKGKVSLFKTYISPWERALGITPQEKSEFSIDPLSNGTKADLCHYKSFNRTAMPYGGYEKAVKLMTFQMPEFDVDPLVPEPLIVYNQEVSNRPSFNRTPVPWLGSGEPTEYNIEVNVPPAGETEEL